MTEKQRNLFSQKLSQKLKAENDSLVLLVEQYAKKNPEKYRRAQQIGKEIMEENLPEKKEGYDDKEEKERAGRLATLIKFNGPDVYLHEDEKVLARKYKILFEDS